MGSCRVGGHTSRITVHQTVGLRTGRDETPKTNFLLRLEATSKMEKGLAFWLVERGQGLGV